MLRARRWLWLSLLTVTSSAWAARTETPQQLFQAGDSVTLSSIGATIVLPPSPAGWTVNVGIESTTNYDIIRRQDPTNPALRIDLDRPQAADCATIERDFDKMIGLGLKLRRHDPTPFAPASFARWAYELTFYQDKSVLKLCTDTASGPVLADIDFQGSLAALDPMWVMPLLDEIGRKVGGARRAVPSTQPAILAESGLPVAIPPGFTTRVVTSSLGEREDLIERAGPVYFAILVRKRTGTCAVGGEGAQLVDDPPYLPRGFEHRVAELSTGGTNVGVMCLQKSGYCVVASVGFAGSLGDPTVLVTRTILAPMVVDDRARADATPAIDDEKPKSNVAVQLGYAYTSGDAFERSSGVSVGLDSFAHSQKGPIGAIAEVAGGVGVGSDGFLPWDVRLGLGPAMIVQPLVLGPLIGFGGDGIGGTSSAEAIRLHVDSGAYWYYGARMLVRFGALGVSGSWTEHRRGPDDWSKERRLALALQVDHYSLGVRTVQFSGEADRKANLTTFYLAWVY